MLRPSAYQALNELLAFLKKRAERKLPEARRDSRSA
jgi:hypothetical protein